MNIRRKLLAAWLSSAMLVSAPGPWLSSALAGVNAGAGRAMPRAALRAAATSKTLPGTLSPIQGLSIPSAPAIEATKLPGTIPAAAAPEAKPDLKTTLGQAQNITAAESPSSQAGRLASFLDNSRQAKTGGSVAGDAAMGAASAMTLSPAAAQAAVGKASSVASPKAASRSARKQSWLGATVNSARSALRGVAVKVKMLAAAAVLMVAASCGGGGGGHDSVYIPPTASPHYVTYAYNGHPLATLPVDSYDTAKEDELLAYINDHRYWLGLPPLTQSFTMGDIARAHSWHMADYHDFFGNYNPEGDGPGTRASLVGEFYFTYDENVVAGWWITDAYSAFQEMLNDPYLRANMEDYWWTHGGAGYRYNFYSTDENYWTVDFKED